MSVQQVDFKAIANAIIEVAEKGKLAEHHAIIFLPGSQKTIQMDHAVKELVTCFQKMSHDEQQAFQEELRDRLFLVKESPHFKTNNKSYASINLNLTPTLLGKEPQSYRDSQKIQNFTEKVFSAEVVPENLELEPDRTFELLNTQRIPYQPSTYDEGKTIEKTWKDGQYEAHESIERKDTVEDLKHIATKQLQYVRGRLNKKDLSQSDRRSLLKQAKHLEKMVDRCEDPSISWANSDYFRDLFRGDPSFDSKKNPQGIAGAIAAWEEKSEEYRTLAPAVNMRYHTCTIEGQTDGCVRLGVISDMSNGFVNLQGLETLNRALLKGDLETASTLRKDMAKEIINVWKNESKNKNIDASAGFALKQLGYTVEEIIQIKTLFSKGKKIDDVLLSLNKNKVDHVMRVLSETIEQRTEVMQWQFLQLVTDHASRLTSEDVNEGLMKMLHVCLLCQDSKSVDGTGWYHNEENEMLDMAAIFEKFDGKKLIADAKGPFIDELGNIHIPPSKVFPKNQEITVRTIFISNSVQGGTKNEGTQKEINDIAVQKLKSLSSSDNFEVLLGGDKTSYSTAANLADLAMEEGFKTSTGCLSAKDRTGLVCAFITDRIMKNHHFPMKARIKFLRNQLKKDSPAVRVIIDNTRALIMKIKPFFIEGITKDTKNVKSFFVRSVVYVRQGIEILKERERIKEREKT